MARIPIYEQQTTANGAMLGANAQGVRVRSAVGEAGGALAQAGMNVVAADMEARRLAKAAEEDDATVWLQQSLAEARLQTTENAIRLRETAEAGGAGYTDAVMREFEVRAKGMVKAAPTDRARAMAEARLTEMRASVVADAMQWEAGRRRENRVTTAQSAIEKAAAAAELDPNQYEALLAEQVALSQQLEMHPDDRDKLAAEAQSQIAVGAMIGRIRQAAGTKRPGPLRAVLDQLNSDEPEGPVAALDLRAKLNLRNQVEGELRAMEAEARAKRAEARVAFERRLTDSMSMFMVAGYDPQPIQPGEFVAMYGDTEGQREWERYSRTQQLGRDRVELRAMPLAEQAALLESRRPVPGQPDFAQRAKEFEVLQSAQQQVLAAIKQDEVAYAAQAGIAEVGPINLADTEAAAAELRNRESLSMILQRDFGGQGRMLSQSEFANLRSMLDQQTAGERAQTLATIRGGLSRDGYLRLVGELREDSPVTAIAGTIAETHPRRAEMILAGEDLLNPSKAGRGGDGKPVITMPRDSDLRAAWARQVGDAYSAAGPRAESDAFQAFRAYYTAAAHRLGRLSPDRVDREVADAAIVAATGGVTEINDSMVVLPYGADADDVEQRLAARWDQVRGAAGFDRVPFRAVRLKAIADGVYQVSDGTGPIVGPDGRPLALDIRQ